MAYSKKQQAGYFSKGNRRSIKISRADRWFSKYIRARDCISTHDNTPVARCVTCGRIHPLKEMDAGHFVKRDRNATRFDERNVHAQCKHCNDYRSGEEFKYSLKIDSMYGRGTAELLYNLGGTQCRLRKMDLDYIADKYREKFKEVCIDKGIQPW